MSGHSDSTDHDDATSRGRLEKTDDEFEFDSVADDDVEDGDARSSTHFDVPAPQAPRPGQPEIEVRIDVRYEWGSLPAAADPAMNVLVRLTPYGGTLSEITGGPDVHLVLALDISASMSHRDKLPVLEEALRGLVDEIQTSEGGEVLLTVIVFAKGSKTLYHAIPASQLAADDLIEAIRSSPLLYTRYSDAVGALSRATRVALDSHRKNLALPVRIVLLTDGNLQDEDGAAHKIARIAHMPIDIGALAFGADADVACLKRVVGGRRGGTVKHVRKETLEEAFRRLAMTGRRVAARLSLLRFETASGVVGGAAFRFRPARHAYGECAFDQGRVFETDLGTLECGRSYSLLFQIRLPETDAYESEIGEIVLRVPSFGGPKEFRRILGIPRHQERVDMLHDPVVAEARSIVEAIDSTGSETLLQGLRARRKLYVEEHRDPYLLQVLDKAIAELEEAGDLDALSNEERAALDAHTITVDLGRPPLPNRREFTFG
jgi:hypothetical protein